MTEDEYRQRVQAHAHLLKASDLVKSGSAAREEAVQLAVVATAVNIERIADALESIEEHLKKEN